MPAVELDLAISFRGLLSLLIAFICSLLWNRYTNGLQAIPGPFLASFTSLWKFYIVYTEQMPWRNTALHEKYGPLVRIGPSHISASSPEALSAVHVQKKGFQKVGSPFCGLAVKRMVLLKSILELDI